MPSRDDKIRALIDFAVNDQGVQFANTVSDVLYGKASQELEDLKIDVAKRIMSGGGPVTEAAKTPKIHGMAVHLSSTDKKRKGLPLYKVTGIGQKVTRLKIGEHLTDTQLDDLKDAGHKIKVTD